MLSWLRDLVKNFFLIFNRKRLGLGIFTWCLKRIGCRCLFLFRLRFIFLNRFRFRFALFGRFGEEGIIISLIVKQPFFTRSRLLFSLMKMTGLFYSYLFLCLARCFWNRFYYCLYFLLLHCLYRLNRLYYNFFLLSWKHFHFSSGWFNLLLNNFRLLFRCRNPRQRLLLEKIIVTIPLIE